ncbi:MAG: alpha/beta hydrolase [Pseudomonadota bacterium]
MKKRYFLLLILGALGAAAFALRTPDTDPQAMIAKYANAQSRFVENSEGLRVHYRDQGKPDGVPVVLAHGTAASLHTWAPLVERLGDKYRVITYTQPGHGLTGPHPREDYSFAGMADALDLVAEELALESFVLGGNSMGGWIAWRYALANPEKIEALLLLDASGAPAPTDSPYADWDDDDAPLAFRILSSPFGLFFVENYTPRAFLKSTSLQAVSVKSVMDEEAVDRYWQLLRYPGNRRAAALLALSDRELAYADRLHEIDQSTLIIWGAEDMFIPVDVARTFDERIPDSDLVIYDGIGHIPMEEAPDRTANDIDAFLKRALGAAE